MELSRITPELRSAARRTPALPLHRAWVRKAINSLTSRERGVPTFDGVRLEKVADPAVRVYTPEAGGNGAALLWVHGGGLIIGSAVQDDQLCATTARELGIVVVSVDYRLAPDHPFPVPLDDCLAAWDWLQGQAAARGVDPARVAVGGQSAGGGLAAALVHRLHDRGGVQPAAQWLLCPMLDDRTAARRELDAVRHRVWTNKLNHTGWSAYLGVEPGAETLPEYAAPARRGELAGLPPAFVGVGDVDLFHDEDGDYVDRLRAAGVDVELDVVPGAPHGFEAWAPANPVSVAYLGRARAWLRRALSEAHR